MTVPLGFETKDFALRLKIAVHFGSFLVVEMLFREIRLRQASGCYLPSGGKPVSLCPEI
jgi:hypothetical protein